MGDAKRQAEAYNEAKNHLFSRIENDEKIVAETSIALFERFILPNRYTGGCYLTTMILYKFLKDEKGILTKPVIGFVNDGTDNIMMSHAWLECEGLKTDLTLYITEYPDVQIRGPLLILDQVMRPGKANYTYHLYQSPEAITEMERMKSNRDTKQVAIAKEIEHKEMLERVQDERLMSAYLDAAPSQMGYAAMTKTLR